MGGQDKQKEDREGRERSKGKAGEGGKERRGTSRDEDGEEE
jgi:hypothetical protein